MSRESIIQHLQLQGEEHIRRLRQEAEEKVREHRAAAQRTLAARCAEAKAEAEAKADRYERETLMEAKRQAGRIRVLALAQLAARLKDLAWQHLPTLRESGYDRLFALLVNELPPEPWDKATVHTHDLGLAAAALPNTAVTCSSHTSGGIAVSGRGGRVRVDNTLEKRLERAWPELLPALLKDLRQEVNRDQPPP